MTAPEPDEDLDDGPRYPPSLSDAQDVRLALADRVLDRSDEMVEMTGIVLEAQILEEYVLHGIVPGQEQ